VPQDVHITTRYKDSDFLQALFGGVHETGHARYQQNLPQEWLDQPMGIGRSMAYRYTEAPASL
jgi:carboxypeptidase Taq